MWLRAGFAWGALVLTGWANAPIGIPRELAAERAAALSNIRYKLSFTMRLQPNAHTVPGTEELRFNLSKDGDLLLDFRGESARALVINGQPAPVVAEKGHILLPAAALHRGENVLSLRFDTPVGTAGQPITRYEDKEDGSVYFYTLFVPMDASAAFPCFDQPDLKAKCTLDIARVSNDIVIANARQKSEGQMGPFATD
jgi:aminopeptidase N